MENLYAGAIPRVQLTDGGQSLEGPVRLPHLKMIIIMGPRVTLKEAQINVLKIAWSENGRSHALLMEFIPELRIARNTTMTCICIVRMSAEKNKAQKTRDFYGNCLMLNKYSRLVFSIFKIVWLMIGIYLLYQSIDIARDVSLSQTYKMEGLLKYGLVLAVLCFPANLLWWLILFLLESSHLYISSSSSAVQVDFFGELIFGYIQWFIIIPKLYRVWKKKRQAVTTT